MFASDLSFGGVIDMFRTSDQNVRDGLPCHNLRVALLACSVKLRRTSISRERPPQLLT